MGNNYIISRQFYFRLYNIVYVYDLVEILQENNNFIFDQYNFLDIKPILFVTAAPLDSSRDLPSAASRTQREGRGIIRIDASVDHQALATIVSRFLDTFAYGGTTRNLCYDVAKFFILSSTRST